MRMDSQQTQQGGQGRWNAVMLSVIAGGLLLMEAALRAAPLDRFNIIVADSQATVYLYDPESGDKVVIAQGVTLDRPYDIVQDHKGNLIVSDTGTLRIVSINPLTGQQTVVASGPPLGVPFGMAVDQLDRLYVANSQAILRIDPRTGKVEVFAEGKLLQVPLDVAVAPNGKLYVADAVAGVIVIDEATRAQNVLAKNELVRGPIGVAVDGNHSLYVADAGARCVVAINLQDNSQQLMSEGGFFATPLAIGMTASGTVLVSDPDAFGLDGGILAIGKDGTQVPLMRGSGALVNPRGIAVVAASRNASENPRQLR